MKFLDDLPVATLTFLAGVVLIIVAYVSNDVSFDSAWKDLLFLGGGSGAIGFVRNGANKGVR